VIRTMAAAMDDLTNLLDTTGQYKSTYERSVIAIKTAISQTALRAHHHVFFHSMNRADMH
jgi:hypothetical protein